MDTSTKIKYLREKNNLTQEQLGEKLGVQKSAINKYESGLVKNIKVSTIQKMADIFNVSPTYFTKDTEEDDFAEFYSRYLIECFKKYKPLDNSSYVPTNLIKDLEFDYRIANQEYLADTLYFFGISPRESFVRDIYKKWKKDKTKPLDLAFIEDKIIANNETQLINSLVDIFYAHDKFSRSMEDFEKELYSIIYSLDSNEQMEEAFISLIDYARFVVSEKKREKE